jgi:uncharacterized protein YyaL (SSP411 family)
MEPKRNSNRLAGEKSPYLLQHARNPVEWYPWGREAFERARAEDRPVLLSIGYSTCHWCHVMEAESFSDEAVAELMNRHFVCIKVDREERPDIDNIYMNAVVAMTGRGGWPLTVFLTPDQKPFFGGTYFPPDDRWGMSGFKTVLLSVAEAWKDRRDEIARSGELLTRALGERRDGGAPGVSLGEDTLAAAYKHFRSAFDSGEAGFGQAPKFPMAHNLSFLLRYAGRDNASEALVMVERTLRAMAAGGIYDQIGGGFHRYSTDDSWRVPHFEKMLYDQAMLSRVYLEAYQATGDDRFARTARETLDYVRHDMTDAGGGFYSAEDADSPLPDRPEQRKEGAFYLWTLEEVEALLGAEDAGIVAYHFGIRPEGNAISDPHGELGGKNVIYMAHSPAEAARRFGRSPQEMGAALDAARERMLAARSRRPRPHLDDKVLTDWNGLMISSFAYASRVLNETAYRDAAERAARFVLANMVDSRGRLLHRYHTGTAGIPASIDDYAFFIYGLIDLYEATFDCAYLKEAIGFAHIMSDLFWDGDAGGFFFTARDSEELIVRTKQVHDGAIPSGNSVAAHDLLRLGRLTGITEFESLVGQLMNAFSADISGMPGSHAFMLTALDFATGPTGEIVIAEGEDPEALEEMVRAVYRPFAPNRVVAMLPAPGEAAAALTDLAPFLAGYRAIGGKTTAYVCIDRACRTPATSVEDLDHLLAH